jgi:hypothetical protein
MYKSIKNIIPFIAVVVMASSCERDIIDLPESSGNDPIFRLDMNLDNKDLAVVAGVDDIYNHTDFDIDQDEVYTFEGLLSNTECNRDCPNSYRFKFRNYEAGSTAVNTQQSLSAKSYPYKFETAAAQDAIEVHVVINTDVANPKYTWTIDGVRSNQQANSDILLINVKDNQRLAMALEVYDESTGLTSLYSQEVILEEDLELVNSSIEVVHIEGDSVLLKSRHSASADLNPFGTSWAIEGLNGSNPMFISDPNFEIGLRLGDGKSVDNITSFTGGIASGGRNIVGIDMMYDPVNDALVYHEVDFNYSIEKRIAQGSVLALQTFEFELYDDAGVLYSSAKGEQTENAFFEILDTKEYIENEQGQKTVQVTCRFSCQVFSDSGDAKTITNANAVIAVAIP